jgi:2-polyprenyl-6-methoxyphenol hydroxylase-like FAD-dependent oxidoreductase
MIINIISSSLLSNIAALSLNKYSDCNINIQNNELKTYSRYYSLNYFSKIFLENINVWEKLSPLKITPYKKIEIYRNEQQTISFNANDIDIDSLGYIVSEDELSKAVTETLLESESINYIKDQRMHSTSSDINIISDYSDVDSEVKSKHFVSESYNQTAININITHTKDNENIPRQIFYKDEILGFLPTSNKTYNLIWTMPNKLFDQLLSTNPDEYLKLIQKRAQLILGEIQDLSIGQSFPLSSRHSDCYCYQNNILVGESAHKFHPLAGLGLNMGIEDIHVLSTLVSKNSKINIISREYVIKRIFRNSSLNHILNTIIKFHSFNLIPDFFRRIFLNIFDRSIFLKPTITRNATGFDNLIK